MRRVVWTGVACVVVITAFGTFAVLASQVLHGTVDGRSLFVSVLDESGGGNALNEGDHGRCRKARPLEWECDVPGRDPSGFAPPYRVRIHPGSSCWDADGGGSGLPEHVSGCVHLWE